MIIKGSARGQSAADVTRLVRHLLAEENEAVTILGARGVSAANLAGALTEMRAITLATRTRRALYHASISVTPKESRQFDTNRWVEAADALEAHLGMSGHQRVLIQHAKQGRVHLHTVWCRVHPTTLKVAHDGQSYARHEACARALEARWRLAPVIGAHTRDKGIKRPVAALRHKERQAELRTGLTAAEVAADIRRAWDASQDGRGFKATIEAAGLILAAGRRGIVVIDRAGVPHALARRLGLKAAQVRARLKDIDIALLPSVDGAKAAITRQPQRRSIMQSVVIASRTGRPSKPDPAYWTGLGYQIAEEEGLILVTLGSGAVIEDHGDRLVIRKDGPPTEEETRIMVEAAKARGWEGIRFTGGTPEWQRQARLEAIKMGYDPAAISIECEDHLPPLPVMMPDHIRRRLTGKTPEDTPPALPASDAATTPAPGYRP